MKALLLASVVLTGSLPFTCQSKKRAQEDQSIVATVNGETLPVKDFERELAQESEPTEGPSPVQPEQIDVLKHTVLQRQIEQALRLQAARQRGVTVPPEELDRRMLRIRSDYREGGFEQELAQGALSEAELKQKTLALLTTEKLFSEHVYPRVGITEAELRKYFEAHPEQFQEPEQVHAAQLVVKDIEEARRLQAQLKAGKPFAELARKYSLSADAKVGGDLGYFPRGVMPPQFDEVAFRLGVNQVSDVVATDFGFHLFKVLDKRPARHRELAQVRAEVEARLLQEKRAQAEVDFLKSLKDKADIHINEAALAAVQVKPRPAAPPNAEP